MTRNWCLALAIGIVAAGSPAGGDGPPAPKKYRTDGGDESLPWYRPRPLEFPPPDSAHREWATLVAVDPILRTGRYRLEREGEHWNQVLPFALLPYATVRYLGAPAAVGDIPPGTRVRLELYQDPDGKFTRVLGVRDHASVMADDGVTYKVTRVDPGAGRFSVEPAGKDGPAPAGWTKLELRYTDQTRWWKGQRIATASDLTVGQTVRANMLRQWSGGPPDVNWCTGVWLDAESRAVAADLQARGFRAYLKARGLPARVDRVDHPKMKVFATLLATGDDTPAKDLKAGATVRIAAADEALRTYEPAGGQGGPDAVTAVLRAADAVPSEPGSGGMRVTLECPLLYDGFRPGRFVRLYPDGWNIPILPVEERLPTY